MKINILTLVTAAIGGGVERLIYDQIRFYNTEKFNLHVVTLRKGYLDKQFSRTTASYTCLNVKHKISYKAFKQLKNYIRCNNIDIIHTHLYLPDIYGFLMKTVVPRIKLFTTKHNTNQFRKKLFWGVLDHILSLPATRIIAVSQSVKEFVTKYEFIPPHRITVIYHGVDTGRFTEKANVSHLRKEFNIKTTDFVIGIVGRITAQKGHEYLFHAVNYLKTKIPNIKVLVIGTGELKQELLYLCHTLNLTKFITFLGYRQDMPELYRLLNVLCLPSIYEGLGLVLVEAMLSGTVVVGADIHGIKEIIEDGVNGFLIQPGNSHSISTTLYRIFKSEYDKKLLIRAKETAKRFDYRRNLKTIEREYLRVAKK